MSTPEPPPDERADDQPSRPGADPAGARPGSAQPSLVPGVVMLGVAAVLIVIVLIKPDMPHWLKIVISVLALLVVIALLVYAFRLFRSNGRQGSA